MRRPHQQPSYLQAQSLPESENESYSPGCLQKNPLPSQTESESVLQFQLPLPIPD